jgi:transcriptional regulator with XRE-family HTH domain
MKSHFIREWRLHRKMTQAQLAAAMGISRSYLTMIERGGRRYDQNFLENAALALDSTPADLIARPPGALQRIDRLLADVGEDERARIENAIRALLGEPHSG